MRVATRLMLTFSLVIALTVLIALASSWQQSKLADSLEEIADNRMAKVEKFTRLRDNVHIIGRVVRNSMLGKDSGYVEQQRRRVGELDGLNDKLMAELDRLTVLPEDRALLQRMQDIRAVLMRQIHQVVSLSTQGQVDDAVRVLTKDAAASQTELFKLVDESNETQRQLALTRAHDSQEQAHRDAALMLGLAALAAVAGLLLSWQFARYLGRMLGAEPGELGAAAQRVAEGDLSSLPNAQQAPAGSVLASLAHMQASLASIVAQVRASSDSIATGSSQIATGNGDLSQRTEEQASALQQTTASMEQLGSTVDHNANSAGQANQLAQGAAQVATQGGEVVARVVSTMQGISDSSRRIGDIIGVIDGIAFQTNILALNAAVEAARAGEQGRGFAVVAGEVRTLAQRSAEAAREIKSLISRNVEQVEQRSGLVDQAGATMQDIVGAIRRVSDIVAEISAASTEQSRDIRQVSEAVGQMDQATQQNAALVEESAAAAESLRQQAQQLVSAVAVFRLQAGARPAPAAAPLTAPAAKAAEARAPAPAAPVSRASAPAPRPQPRPALALQAADDGDWASF
ncbi:MAG: methyl-accepting chemotaxis protein [Roseateles depolymerans]|uniref:Methyl-accepting chemotaxis protein n=1 Tax=Roseateles depolymerans TaxID=76731 RepID=A0A2W5DZ57_9BURK|nr:MAG: methyl-accepting chemotaxis protein [Roseateles depolymerans]